LGDTECLELAYCRPHYASPAIAARNLEILQRHWAASVGKHRHRNNRQVGLCVCEGRVTPDDLGLCGVPVAFVFVRRNFDGASYPEQDPTVRCSALVSHKAPKSLILGRQSCHCDGVEGK
jgi:hypothetical protein